VLFNSSSSSKLKKPQLSINYIFKAFICTQGRTNIELFERGYPISSEQLFMIFILGYEALIRFWRINYN